MYNAFILKVTGDVPRDLAFHDLAAFSDWPYNSTKANSIASLMIFFIYDRNTSRLKRRY